MQRVVILGGGVGGTLTANLVARKLKARIAKGEAKVTVVDESGSHAYQPGYMYIAMGNERPEKLLRRERSLLDGNVELVVDTIEQHRRRGLARPASLGRVAPLRPARHRDRLADRPRDDRALRHGGPPLLHRRGRREAPQGARRLHRRQDRDRDRRDPLQVPAGAPRGRLPRRVRAARARPARQDRAPVPVADQPRVHHRERQRDGDADLRGEGDRPPAPGRHRLDRRRAQGGHHRRDGGVPVRPPDLRPAAQGRPGR